MTKAKAWTSVGCMLALAAGAAFAAAAADDDLAVVKRAVAVQSDGDPDDAPRTAAVRKSSRRPQWLKVRVVEAKDGRKEEKVSVTLPLSLLAVLGRDATVDLSEMGVKGVKAESNRIRIMDVLESLEPGSLLVEVREEDSHVRVWVE